MAVHLVTIKVLGASFSIQTDESREYMEGLLGELERRLTSLQDATKVTDPLKLSILASITLLDDLASLRAGRGGLGDEELGRLADRLIHRLDDGLALAQGPEGVGEAGSC